MGLEELSDLLAGDIRKALKNASPVRVDRIDMATRPIQLPQVPTDRALILHRMQTAERLLKRGDLPRDSERQLRFLRDAARAVFDRFRRTPLTEMATEIQSGRLQDILLVANPGETFITFANQTVDLPAGYKVLVIG